MSLLAVKESEVEVTPPELTAIESPASTAIAPPDIAALIVTSSVEELPDAVSCKDPFPALTGALIVRGLFATNEIEPVASEFVNRTPVIFERSDIA